MSKILILEDNAERSKAFRRKFIGNCVTIVAEACEVIALLGAENWDALFLDHDLGGEVMVESGPGTGYEVACWLEQNSDRKPEQIVIHSANPVGRLKMKAALPDALVCPFAWK